MDGWDGGGDYELFMGRWSRIVARDFIGDLGLGNGLSWLDVGCGTGALLESVIDQKRPLKVAGVDASQDYAADARQRFGADVDIGVASGESLPFDDDSFDVVVSGLLLNFMSDPVAAVREWGRVARPGGSVATYVWDYTEGMEFLRRFWDVVVELDPGASDLDEGVRFSLCAPRPLARTFEEAGLASVSVSEVTVDTVFASFDDYWSPFLAGQGPAGVYVSALTGQARGDLGDALRAKLDGKLDLQARAWTVRGQA